MAEETDNDKNDNNINNNIDKSNDEPVITSTTEGTATEGAEAAATTPSDAAAIAKDESETNPATPTTPTPPATSAAAAEDTTGEKSSEEPAVTEKGTADDAAAITPEKTKAESPSANGDAGKGPVAAAEEDEEDDNPSSVSMDDEQLQESKPEEPNDHNPLPIVSSTKKSRPPYHYDPDKITLRFLFANRDGLTVTVECKPGDTVGEVKGALLSVWPKDLPNCSGGDQLRLVCMGKGILMPDTRTLEDCEVPVFKTHPTPVNVSVKPEATPVEANKSGSDGNNRRGSGNNNSSTAQASQGCSCILL